MEKNSFCCNVLALLCVISMWATELIINIIHLQTIQKQTFMKNFQHFNFQNSISRIHFLLLFVISVSLLMTSCKKEETAKNGVGDNNTENPGGGTSSANQSYPSTAQVIHDAVTDIDNNHYDAVQIGNQVWMAENLRTTRYADGTTIPIANSYSLTSPYRYAPGPYQTNQANMNYVPTLGYLYNWPAVMNGTGSSTANPSGVQGICPNGWHVPSYAEWKELTDYLSSQSAYVCGNETHHIAKAISSQEGWLSDSGQCCIGNDLSANNATGFTARPVGKLTPDHVSPFFDYGVTATFWTATQYDPDDEFAYIRHLDARHYAVGTFGGTKHCGLSVRCIRD